MLYIEMKFGTLYSANQTSFASDFRWCFFGIPSIYPGISRHFVPVASSLLLHSIKPGFIFFTLTVCSIDEFEGHHANRTTNLMFSTTAESEGEGGLSPRVSYN